MMDDLEALKARFAARGQGHVFDHWDSLDAQERQRLAADLASVDLVQIGLWQDLLRAPAKPAGGVLQPLPAIVEGEDPQEDAEAARIGESLLRAGKVAAFTVAGGQGTRLGHAGPKGTFAVSPIRNKPLFQLFAERLHALSRRYGRPIPWYIMTSPSNHEETLAFFRDHQRFGLDADDLRFFPQGAVPALDESGHLVLEAKDRLFRSPDGHGGSLRALHTSGALAELRARGVEEIFYFQVDNPLVRICDPIFLGYHRQASSDFSSKAVPKRDPFEKVGVLLQRDGRPTVIEYSDLPTELRDARDEHGELSYRAGNVAIHILRRAFVEELNRERFSLPWHIARKPVPSWSASRGADERPGAKFETFVFDALPLAARTLVILVDRALEFSPVKNRDGADSPRTAVEDQIELHARWLEAAGVQVPRGAEGRVGVRVEIASSFALGPSDLVARRQQIPSPITTDLYLEG